MRKTVYFELERETPGTYVYTEVDDNGKPIEAKDSNIPTLYIKKKMFKKLGGAPESIAVVVKTED